MKLLMFFTMCFEDYPSAQFKELANELRISSKQQDRYDPKALIHRLPV
jgi:hypothetical protein